MSTIKKTIQINPELFKMGGSKTKKNKEKPLNIPIISPTNLKNKLLNRIKEHKHNEIKERDSKKNETLEGDKEYSNEFYGALNYLSDLSNKHKKDMDKVKYQKKIEEKKSIINNTTLKNYDASPHVELELPPELQEPLHNYIPDLNQLSHNEPIHLQYKIDTEVPHGCLRNGQKPTYRTWKNQTRKNITQESFNSPIIHEEKPMTREQRLDIIKKKLKKIETTQIQPINTQLISNNSAKIHINPIQPVNLDKRITSFVNESENKMSTNIDLTPINTTSMNSIPNKTNTNMPVKKLIKKTIKKTYTLGKSNIYRKVGVLIKDKATRKKILNAHKDLKKVPVNDIKKYLRLQGILKVGSTAPNDVLRKMYESSRLAGEITNTNKEVLLHNFLNGDDTN
jgi:hypothetical protein